MAEKEDPVEAAEAALDESEPTEAEIQTAIGEFTEIDGGDEALPF